MLYYFQLVPEKRNDLIIRRSNTLRVKKAYIRSVKSTLNWALEDRERCIKPAVFRCHRCRNNTNGTIKHTDVEVCPIVMAIALTDNTEEDMYWDTMRRMQVWVTVDMLRKDRFKPVSCMHYKRMVNEINVKMLLIQIHEDCMVAFLSIFGTRASVGSDVNNRRLPRLNQNIVRLIFDFVKLSEMETNFICNNFRE